MEGVATPEEVIGARIRDRLEFLGLSVPAFARQVGVSTQAANRWVRGEAVPAMKRWNDIALVLDVDRRDLFDPEES